MTNIKDDLQKRLDDVVEDLFGDNDELSSQSRELYQGVCRMIDELPY